MKRSLSIFFLAPLLLLAPHAAASCCSGGETCLGTITLGTGRAHDATPTVYVDDRNHLQGDGIWVYLESNGIDGLQDGYGCSAIVPNSCEYCYDYNDAQGGDTLIF